MEVFVILVCSLLAAAIGIVVGIAIKPIGNSLTQSSNKSGIPIDQIGPGQLARMMVETAYCVGGIHERKGIRVYYRNGCIHVKFNENGQARHKWHSSLVDGTNMVQEILLDNWHNDYWQHYKPNS